MTSYHDLSALFVNCTLKRRPERSHTQGLIDKSASIMEKTGVRVEHVRAVDHQIAAGVWPDMTEHRWATDEWPSHVPAGTGRGHPRAGGADLAG